jgi:hypothetical protein
MGWETLDAGVVDLSGDSCLRQVGGHTAGQVRFSSNDAGGGYGDINRAIYLLFVPAD